MKRRVQIIFKLDKKNQTEPRILDTIIDTDKDESAFWNEHFVTCALDGGSTVYVYPTNTVSRIKSTPLEDEV